MPLTLLTAKTSNGAGTTKYWDGGSAALWAVFGTFGGATVTLQFSPDEEVTWLDLGSITAAGTLLVPLPTAPIRASIAGAGGATSISSNLFKAVGAASSSSGGGGGTVGGLLESGGNADAIAASTALAAGEIGSSSDPKNLDPTTTGTLNAFIKGIVDRLNAQLAIFQGWDADTNPSSVSTRAFAIAASNAATAGLRQANVTPYGTNDAVSNNATPGSVVAFSFTLSEANDLPVSLESMIIRATDTGPGTAAAIFRCFFYQSDPTASTGVVGGDNLTFSTKQGTFLGVMEGTFRPFSDGSVARLVPAVIPSIGAAGTAGTLTPTRIISKPTLGAQTFFMLMQTLTVFTPSANSTVFTPTVEGFQFRA